MSGWIRLAGVLLLVLAPLTAHANWMRSRSSSATTAYYYPPPVVYVPVIAPVVPVYPPPMLPYCPQPSAAQSVPGGPAPRLFATPTPAPATSAPATTPPGAQPPPASPPAPGIGESRSYYDAYAVAIREASSRTPERFTIGFWNHSSKDVLLKVDGQPQTLQRGQSLVLTLPKQFVWQIDERVPQNETVPAGQGGVDIVIRR